MPLLRRPAAALHRPAGIPLAGPAAGVAAAFDLAAWADGLDLGLEVDQPGTVYLGTFSRLLPSTLATAPQLRDPSTMTREEIRDAVMDAWERPAPSPSGGRPRAANAGPLIEKLVVVREKHSDGTYHFHAALKLTSDQRFLAAKRTLAERHSLASHWSSPHTQWWSALRYCVYTSDKKPEVDKSRLVWSLPGVAFDVFREAQEAFLEAAWTRRREEKDTEAPAAQERPSFSKLDFNALVVDKGLTTKRKVMAYVQDHGTAVEQAYCAKHQRRLDELLEDAVEWAGARAAAALESKSDWEILCAAADAGCPQGIACVYAEAARSFFRAHAASFSDTRVAASLRAIIVSGPSKERRVPFLVGTTNTGKSTLLESFTAIYGEAAVFHLPAETDTRGGALRGWLQGKRFVFWDEFEPLEFIAKQIMPKTQFLKAFNGQTFEIQMNQRTNDGNKTFKWNRGAAFTAKEKGLWKEREGITSEDIAHIKNRVDIFRCSGKVQPRRGGVPMCQHCLAKWVREGADRHDANQVLTAPMPQGGNFGTVTGLEQLLDTAQVPAPVCAAIVEEIGALGAVDVQELGRSDWEALNAWGSLREFEKRRILRYIPP